MWDLLKNSWMSLKTAFYIGTSIGMEGKQKDFVKNPFKTMNEVTSNESRKNTNDQGKCKKT